MLKLNSGRTDGGHSNGHIPVKYRNQDCEMLMVGDLNRFINGQEGCYIIFSDPALEYSTGFANGGSFYVDEFTDQALAIQAAQTIVGDPVKFLHRQGSHIYTSRGIVSIHQVCYADGGKHPTMPQEILSGMIEFLVDRMKT